MVANGNLGYTDTPSIDDLLNRSDYVHALAEIVEACNTPMTISITGEWGSGKTSFVRQLNNQLSGKPIKFIEFNTWEISQFEQNDNLKLSLLQSFVSEIIDNNSSKKKEIMGKIKKLTWSVAKNIPLNIPFVDIGQVVNIISDYNAESASTTDSSIVGEVKSLKKEIQAYIDSENKRYVIFIDDLDRISPENAIEILEFLKLFLSMKNCVYLVAIDEKVIAQGLKAKYGGADPSFNDSRNYFEKLIQLPFYLPDNLSDDESLKSYITSLLNSKEMKSDEIDEDLISNIVNYSIGGNPRRIKRVLNAYWLLSLLASQAKITAKNELLFFIQCFQTHYNDQYVEFNRLLNRNSYQKVQDVINDLMEKENGQNSDEMETTTETKFNKFISLLATLDKSLTIESLKNILIVSTVTSQKDEGGKTLTQLVREKIPEVFELSETGKLTRRELLNKLIVDYPDLKSREGVFTGLIDRATAKNSTKRITNDDGQVLVKGKDGSKVIFYFDEDISLGN